MSPRHRTEPAPTCSCTWAPVEHDPRWHESEGEHDE